MTADILVGIDAGTSVLKAVAFRLDGTPIAVAALPNHYSPVEDGGVEQDIARTWADAVRALRDLADAVPHLAGRLAAIAVTGQGDGTWLVDGSGAPVAPAWLWLDARATGIAETVRAGPNEATRFAATGTGLAACQQGPQLAWMRRHRPAMLEAAATAFHCKDWLYLCLSGERATDPSEAALSFGDFRTRDYAAAAIESLGLHGIERLLPPIVDGTRHHGLLTDAAARQTGLRAGTPVVLGYIDIVCSALGAGLYDRTPEAGCTILGSTGLHMRLARSADAVELPADRTGYTICFPAPDAYAQLQSNLAATLNIDWVLNLIAGVLASDGTSRSRDELIGRLDSIVESAAPGTLLYHPYIAEGGERGPFLDGAARAGFYGLSSRHGHADLVRSVVEGLCFAARDCYEAMGAVPREVRVSGGATRSRTLRTILSAVLDAPVRPSGRAEAGAAGAAMIAAVSLGLYPDMAACAAAWVAPLLGPAEPPDAALAARYRSLFPSYREARRAMTPVWRGLAHHRTRTHA